MARRSHYLCLLFLVLTAISSSLTIGRIRTYASNVKASIITHASALSVTSIQTYISGVKLSFKKTNWIAVIKKVNRAADKLDALRKSIKLDISAGYGAISSPDIDPSEYDEIILEDFESRKSPVLWAHQVGRQAVQKAPDKALLGGLVLIASELFRRGVNSEKYPLPLSIREFAHTTSIELDTKLEQLSSLEWKADPFLKQEYENLQAQPLEVIDKFISSNILPSVDKDLAPLLLKSLVDRGKVKVITTSIKDLIKLSMVLLRNTATGNIPSVLPPQLAPSILDQTTSSIDMTTSTIIEQVDIVSQGIEEAVDDWNRNVKEFTGSMTGYLNTDRIMSVITGQYISDDSKEKEKERNKERERDREERARERESVKDRLKIDMIENETRMDG